MKKWFLIFLFFFVSLQCNAEKKVLSVDEVMRLTELNSPKLSANRFYELAAYKSVDVARSNYFPTLNFEAIDSVGFPASNPVGVTGLMDSPYREGLAGGLVTKQIVYDFGRTFYDVQAACHETEFARQNTRVTLYQIKQLALRAFYECTFYNTQRLKWENLAKESAIITREATRFVDTGQRSIVDRYLSKAQTEEAQTAQAFYQAKLNEAVKRLAVIMAVPVDGFTCPILPKVLTPSLNPNQGYENSPLLARAVASSRIAKSRLQQEKAQLHPKIVAMASLGGMDKARLIGEKKDVAAGIGLIFPLVDLHASSEVQRAQALVTAKAREVEAERQYLGEANTQYDEIIQSSLVKLNHLRYEYELAVKGFRSAKDRYFALEGDLIDLREAWRNLARVEIEVDQTRVQYLQASGSKALLNGQAD